MSARGRFWAFAVAIGLLATAGFLLALSRHAARPDLDRPEAAGMARAVPGAGESLRADVAVGFAEAEDDGDRALARWRSGPLRAFRSFMAPFTRYEVGALTAPARRKLRHTATRRLARQLLAEPPRLATGRRPARAVLVGRPEVHASAVSRRGGASATAATVVATLRRGETLEPVAFALTRHRSRWLVGGAGSTDGAP